MPPILECVLSTVGWRGVSSGSCAEGLCEVVRPYLDLFTLLVGGSGLLILLLNSLKGLQWPL